MANGDRKYHSVADGYSLYAPASIRFDRHGKFAIFKTIFVFSERVFRSPVFELLCLQTAKKRSHWAVDSHRWPQ